MAKTKETKAKEAKAEAKPEQLAINVDKQEFIRTRDALITSWVSLEGALRDATRAYISHSNAVLGGTENLDLSKLDLTSFLGSAFPTSAPIEAKEDVEDVKVKAKRTRKPKDPNAPKRPLTAYLAWLGENREKIHVELGPGQGRGGISSEGTKRWHALSDDAKQAYKDKYEKEQEKYKEELEAYKARGGGAVDIPAEEDEEDVADTDDAQTGVAQAGAIAPVDSDAASTASDDDSDSDSDEEAPLPPKEPTPPPVKTPRSAAKGGRKKAVKEMTEVPASSPPLPASSPVKSQNAAFTTVNGKRKKETKAETVEEPKKKRAKRGEAAPASTPAQAPKEAAAETPGTSKGREKRDRKKSRKSQGGDA